MGKNKKSQMEILGLAIVIIIVLVVLAFVVTFTFNSAKNVRTSFISAELASNMINTFLKTTAAECSKLTMTELIQDCAQGTGLVCDNGDDSCKYLNLTASQIFENTLEKWKFNYDFSIFTASTEDIIRLGEVCGGEKKSKQFPIPSSVSTIYVKLDICV